MVLLTAREGLGPAESLLNLFLRRRRLRIVREIQLVIVGVFEHVHEFMEFVEAPGFGVGNGRLDPVIARDEHRVDLPHAGATRLGGLIFA